MEVDENLSCKKPPPLVDEYMYRRLVGSLIYFYNTQSYISFAASVLSKFSKKGNHWTEEMHMLKYIKGTLEYCIKGTIEYGITYAKVKTLTGLCLVLGGRRGQ